MKIINLYAFFWNSYAERGWQVWDGNDLRGVFYTRKAAREFVKSAR